MNEIDIDAVNDTTIDAKVHIEEVVKNVDELCFNNELCFNICFCEVIKARRCMRCLQTITKSQLQIPLDN